MWLSLRGILQILPSIIYVNMQNTYMYICLKFQVSITNISKVTDIKVAKSMAAFPEYLRYWLKNFFTYEQYIDACVYIL